MSKSYFCRWIITAGFLCILISCETSNFSTVRVAAYNVEFGKSATPEQIGEMFIPYNLDLILFSEVPGGNWTSRAGKLLGLKYSFTGEISSANHKDKYKSILSRAPLKITEEYPLNLGSGWNPASTVKAMTKINGVKLSCYSLHIASSSGKEQGHAYQLTRDVLSNDKAEKIIIGGDFNNAINDSAMMMIQKVGFVPIWNKLDIDLSTKKTSGTFQTERKGRVIDHILFNLSSGAMVTDGGIIELENPLSDHHPIWAEIVFPH